jgi:hypothetical protein
VSVCFNVILIGFEDFSIRLRLLVGHFTFVLSRFAVLLAMKEWWGLWHASLLVSRSHLELRTWLVYTRSLWAE